MAERDAEIVCDLILGGNMDSERGDTFSKNSIVRFFDLKVGQVLDIGQRWVAILSVDGANDLTLITSDGDKVPVKGKVLGSYVEINVFKSVYVSCIIDPRRLRLRVETTRRFPMRRRPA
jgi:hypothetical protein